MGVTRIRVAAALVAAIAVPVALSSAGCAGPLTPVQRSRGEAVPATPYPSLPVTQRPDRTNLRLDFAEEFESGVLDPTRWNTQLAWGRTNAEELQYYSPGSLDVSGGMLRITARRQATHGKAYSSGAVTSYGKYSFRYGYLEVRARAVKGRALWPAFWMLSTKPKDPNEVDILESLGQNPYRNQMSLHWGLKSGAYKTMTYTGPDFASDFHTYAIDWRPDSMTWYIDDVERFKVRDHIPAVPMYLIANLAVGGSWPGEPDSTTPDAATYVIDYIRVHKGPQHQPRGQKSGATDQ